MIFQHILDFAKKKGPKVYLPFASLIYALLSSQRFTTYKNEKLLDPSAKCTMDLRLTQGKHFDDPDSLAAILASALFPVRNMER